MLLIIFKLNKWENIEFGRKISDNTKPNSRFSKDEK